MDTHSRAASSRDYIARAAIPAPIHHILNMWHNVTCLQASDMAIAIVPIVIAISRVIGTRPERHDLR